MWTFGRHLELGKSIRLPSDFRGWSCATAQPMSNSTARVMNVTKPVFFMKLLLPNLKLKSSWLQTRIFSSRSYCTGDDATIASKRQQRLLGSNSIVIAMKRRAD